MKKQIIISFLLSIISLSAMEDKIKTYKTEYENKTQYEKTQLLIQAAGKGKIPKITALVEVGADICKKTKRYENTPLHEAATKGHIGCLNYLLILGAYIDVRILDRSTPLHISAACGQLECLKELLKACANKNAQDSNGDTPLHRAVKKDNPECIRALLEAGAGYSIENNKKLIAKDCTKSKSIHAIIDEFI